MGTGRAEMSENNLEKHAKAVRRKLSGCFRDTGEYEYMEKDRMFLYSKQTSSASSTILPSHQWVALPQSKLILKLTEKIYKARMIRVISPI